MRSLTLCPRFVACAVLHLCAAAAGCLLSMAGLLGGGQQLAWLDLRDPLPPKQAVHGQISSAC